MIEKWKVGDAVPPEYFDKCVKLCKFRYMARYPQEFKKPVPPMTPITPPSVLHISGCFSSRKKDGWKYIGKFHADIFNHYDIPPYLEEKRSFLGFIKRIFKK